MEDIIKLLSSKEGNLYRVTLSEDTVLFSNDTIQSLGNVKMIGVDLRRLVGQRIYPVGGA